MLPKNKVAAEVEKLWKEIIAERSANENSTDVKSENDYIEEEIEIVATGEHPGERNMIFGCPSLRQRAINGLKVLKASKPDNNGLETDLSDLVSDLFHLAYQAGLEPDEIVRRAHVHFDAEISGDF
jgi:hypothetical protein